MKKHLIFLPVFFMAQVWGAAVDADVVLRLLEEKRAAYGTPGMVVTLIENGKITRTLASGFADREKQKPVRAETQFPAASLTKLMTAALVMRQVEAGRLNLDRPVNLYTSAPFHIQGPDGRPSAASLRHLLSHSSGLPTSWKGIASRGDSVVSLEKYLARGLKASYAPGERIIYANDGFSLAGYIAAAAEKENFVHHAMLTFLQPLRMASSVFTSPWSLQSENFSRAYGGLMGGTAPGEHNDLTAALPAGGLISTAPDLARFALMLLKGGKLEDIYYLKPQSVAELFKIQARPHPRSPMGFGLGFAVKEEQGRTFVWWDGGIAGAAHRLILHPATQSGVVLLSNMSENAASSEAANAIFDLLVPPIPEVPYKPSQEKLTAHTGNYRFYSTVDPSLWFLRYGIDLTLTVKGDSLRYASRLLKEGTLLPLRPGVFRLQHSMLAGADVFFDGETVYLGHLRAERIPGYASATALIGYAIALVLLLFYLLFRVVRRFLPHRKSKSGNHSAA